MISGGRSAALAEREGCAQQAAAPAHAVGPLPPQPCKPCKASTLQSPDYNTRLYGCAVHKTLATFVTPALLAHAVGPLLDLLLL